MTGLKEPLLFCILLAVTGCAYAQTPAVAYTEDGTLYLATASGHILRTVKTRIPIGNFAISPDARRVVFGRPVGRAYGGPLYLLEIASGRLERLTKSCPKTSECGDHVYADPDFSPDGEQVVFAVHYASSGDLVEASGPLAVIDLKTRHVQVLKSTTNVDGQGVAFANDPHWSPDGKEILLSFEIGAAITDPGGTKLRDLSDQLTGGEWTNALGWFGDQCVLYIAGDNVDDAEGKPVRVLNLESGESQALGELIHAPEQSLVNMIAFSPRIRVRREGQDLVFEGVEQPWRIPYKQRITFVQILAARTGARVAPR